MPWPLAQAPVQLPAVAVAAAEPPDVAGGARDGDAPRGYAYASASASASGCDCGGHDDRAHPRRRPPDRRH